MHLLLVPFTCLYESLVHAASGRVSLRIKLGLGCCSPRGAVLTIARGKEQW